MAEVNVKLLRRLQGKEKGDSATYSEADAKRLEGYGAVKIIGGKAPESEGPSLASMTKAELLDVAKAEGVAIETDDNNADLVRKIEKARK